MNGLAVILIMNMTLAAILIYWVERSVYEGRKNILYFLIVVIPVPTLVYLSVMSTFTDQLRKKKG